MLAIFHASEKGDLEKVRSLVEKGANKEATDGIGRTALYIAVDGGHLEVVRYLVEQGANKEAVGDG